MWGRELIWPDDRYCLPAFGVGQFLESVSTLRKKHTQLHLYDTLGKAVVLRHSFYGLMVFDLHGLCSDGNKSPVESNSHPGLIVTTQLWVVTTHLKHHMLVQICLPSPKEWYKNDLWNHHLFIGIMEGSIFKRPFSRITGTGWWFRKSFCSQTMSSLVGSWAISHTQLYRSLKAKFEHKVLVGGGATHLKKIVVK